jgi:hypothetical protein
MNNPTERKHTAVKVRYTAEEFIRLKKAFARSTCRTIAGYVRRISLQQPVEILQRNASFDEFIGEVICLRKEMASIRELSNWSTDHHARLLELQAGIQTSIDKIAKLCMP